MEDFWAVYNHTMRPGEMGPAVGDAPADLHVFREGIKPAWEDPSNKCGCKMSLRVRKRLTTQSWERILLGLVGGSLPAAGSRAAVRVPEGAGATDTLPGALAGSLVVGAVVSVRHHEDTLSLWLRSCHDVDALAALRDQLCELLRAPASVDVDIKMHDGRTRAAPTLPPRPGADVVSSRAASGNRAGSAGGSTGGDSERGRQPGRGADVAPTTARGPGLGSGGRRKAGSGGVAAGPRREVHARSTEADDGDRWAQLRGDAPRRRPAYSSAHGDARAGGSWDASRSAGRGRAAPGAGQHGQPGAAAGRGAAGRGAGTGGGGWRSRVRGGVVGASRQGAEGGMRAPGADEDGVSDFAKQEAPRGGPPAGRAGAERRAAPGPGAAPGGAALGGPSRHAAGGGRSASGGGDGGGWRSVAH